MSQQQQQQGNQPLPSKEANLLRQVVKFYESKQYKKGLKSADQILKKFPAHGETLAMKGLTLNCLDKKEDAYEYVRKGLQSDVKSHVCWHVYGLLYRSDRLYKKAITCYLNALKHDKDNIQILRDLALLQIQMRDLNGFLDTRHRLLQLRPSNRNNWIAFAIGHYLNKNYNVAVQVLSAYESTLEVVSKEDAYEHSEMLMLKATILEEPGCIEDAVKLLDTSRGMIKDRLGWMEMKARLLTKLESSDVAQDIYRKLLKIFPDNYDYHRGLMKSLGIEEVAPGKWKPEDQAKLTEVYDELLTQHPRSMACARIPLDFKEGDTFMEAVSTYVIKFLNRGIPSLFSDLKPLYRSPEKGQALGKFFEEYRSRQLDTVSSTSDANPQAIVWVLYYLSLHYDLLGKHELALERVSEALNHTPSVMELELARSKVLKHVGDLPGAAAAADCARKLDLADRYLNCIAVKAAFRAGQIDEAEKMAALFTKDENQISNLVEMQCMWYEIACGNAHLRNKDYGKALKKFLGVSKHFEDFVEDQFDFHGYCIRKMTLRSYIELLRMEDALYGELSFSKAAWGAIQCYLDLHDDPAQGRKNSCSKPEPSESEKSTKMKKEEEKAKLKDKSKGKKPVSSAVKVDPDPDGDLLAATDSPLDEATKLVTMLREHAGMRIQTHKFAFEVYMRKKRMLLALSAVQRGLQLDGRGSAVVHNMIVRFCRSVVESQDSASTTNTSEPSTSDGTSPADTVIQESVQKLLEGSSLLDYNEEYLKKYGQSDLVARSSAAEMLALLSPDEKHRSVKLIMEEGTKISMEGCKEEDCQNVHKLLGNFLDDTTAASKWKEHCSTLFQWSSYFDGPKQAPVSNGVVNDTDECALSGP